MPDFSQYLPPGVYVEENPTPLVTVSGVAPSIVGIVGPAVGYRMHTESVVLTGVAEVTLANLGIDIVTGFEVRNASGDLYVDTTDYILAQAEIGETGTHDDATTIARVDEGSITDGETVFITYRYTDEEYGLPYLSTDYDTIKEIFGEPIDTTTGEIISPLSLAAKIAFDNGASQVALVATPTAGSASREEIQSGYARLSSVPSVGLVVPLPVGITGTEEAPGDVSTVGADLALFCDQSSELRDYMVGFYGTESSVTTPPLDIADAVSGSRVALCWPNKLLFYNGYANQTLTISGYYLAAAVAGLASSLSPQIPLTRKLVRGFAGLPPDALATMTTSNKNAWSSGGVLVIEPNRNSNLVIRHGVSTDPSTLFTSELSLTRQKDAMMRLLSDTIESSGLIGSPIEAETPVRVKGVISGGLETLVGSDIIVGYTNLLVRQLTVDPTVIEVKYAYQPAYPLNYVVISFQVSAVTGELSEAA